MTEIVLAAQPRQIQESPEEMLRRLIDARVQEILAEKDTLILQPFFTPKPVADVLKRLQSVHEQRKHAYKFEDYGCMICGTREARHASLAMCQRCLNREVARTGASIRKRMKPMEVEPARLPVDRVTLATAALARPHSEPQMVFADGMAKARAALARPRVSPAELEQLLAVTESQRDRAIIAALYATGCWVAELVRMRIEDIEWGNSTVEVFRQGKFWAVPLDARALEALQSHIGKRESGFVFQVPSRKVRPRHSGSIKVRRSGSRLCWVFVWRERAQSPGVLSTRQRAKILGYAEPVALSPRLYVANAKNSRQQYWCISWREVSESGKGRGHTKFLGKVKDLTREQAQVLADEHTKAFVDSHPRLETLTREQAEAKAAEFLKETLGRTVETSAPIERPISFRVAAEVVRVTAERAGLPHIDADSMRRRFSGGGK